MVLRITIDSEVQSNFVLFYKYAIECIFLSQSWLKNMIYNINRPFYLKKKYHKVCFKQIVPIFASVNERMSISFCQTNATWFAQSVNYANHHAEKLEQWIEKTNGLLRKWNL